ncbi:outer membrane protein, OMP85 family, putative [Synechococcus sp. PCC 7335]|uniref:BamA/TamA family outer membrane protein n=1 Tax=Synechococcus sp. (strain ATCC 29403 / PCC 7335) TaxID=91464 RepID=UPI00017ECB0C|nr:BamA/TamA family outer membrane protein [Synechococcus sp. PCC 7335]EDX85444.1 outer membrane protein, OMP85 family, putative [Synechococcus sp. PCC 7335]
MFYEPLSIKQRLVVVWVASVKVYLLSSAFPSWKLKKVSRIVLSAVVGPAFVFNLGIGGKNQALFEGGAIASQPIDALQASISKTGDPHLSASQIGTSQLPQSTIADIQVRVIDELGAVHSIDAPYEFVQAFNLQPGDPYDPQAIKVSLAKVEDLAEQITLTTEPTADPHQVALVVTVREPNSFFWGFGRFSRPRILAPSALIGPFRPDVTDTVSNRAVGFSVGAYAGLDNIGNSGQVLAAGVVGGVNAFGVEVDYGYRLDDSSGIVVNFANQRGVETEFDEGEIDIDTPSGDDPWVHRIGGGAAYFRRFNPALSASAGLAYQRVTVRDGAFSGDTFAFDEVGNPLTVSDSGADDLLTIKLVGALDYRDDPIDPASGSRLLVGIDQSIPVGNAGIFFNRISGSYTHFIPLNLFGFAQGNRTLVLNAQGGTIIGDAPPYETFSLGGPNSIRGYSRGEVSSGRSFVQATAEYRFPIANFSTFNRAINLGGTLFTDFGSDLGSGDTVIGVPAEARDKPGSGFGGGIGLRAVTDFATGRAELGVNDQGDINVLFSVGDRF